MADFGYPQFLPLTETAGSAPGGAPSLLPLAAGPYAVAAPSFLALTASGTANAPIAFSALTATGVVAGGSPSFSPLTASAVGGELFNGAWEFPFFSIEGTAETRLEFTGGWQFPMFAAAGEWIAGSSYSGSFRFPMFEMEGTYLAGSAFSGAWELPMFSSIGTFGSYQYQGTWEFPMFFMAGVTQSDIEQTYRGWPVNLKNMGLTEYTNFNFNSMTKFNGEYLAAGATGLMALSGEDDRGTAIDARIRLGLTDFGIEQLKRLEEAFVTYRSEGDLVFRVIIDGGQTYEYSLTATGNLGMATNRAKIGKAIKSNFWCIEIENINGAAFDLQDITLHPVVLARKIGRPPNTGVFTGRATFPMFTGTGQF